MGCALAVALATGARPILETIARRIALPAIACFLALLMVLPSLRLFSAWVLAFAICCACLILRSLDSRSALAKVLSLRPLLFLGHISYSLYLWHVPIYWVLGLGLYAELMDVPALALSLGFAIASCYLVEMPFLRRKRRSRSFAESRESPEGADGGAPLAEAHAL